MATYEGKWSCPFCSFVNRGRDSDCHTCGARRADDVEFFLDDRPVEVINADLLALASAGPDWVCNYCRSANRNLAKRCVSCGNVRDGLDTELEAGDASAIGEGLRSTAQKTGLGRTLTIAGLIIVAMYGIQAACISCNFYPGWNRTSTPYTSNSIRPIASTPTPLPVPQYSPTPAPTPIVLTDVSLKVTGMQWRRNIEIEELETITGTGWESELPYGARIRATTREIRKYEQRRTGTRPKTETTTERVYAGTERYVCGRRNMKNGFFQDVYCSRSKYTTRTKTKTTQEPVYTSVPNYQNKHTYEVDRWQAVDGIYTSGKGFKPFWGNPGLTAKRRESGRTGTYIILLTDTKNGKVLEYYADADSWPKYKLNKLFKGKIDQNGNIHSLR